MLNPPPQSLRDYVEATSGGAQSADPVNHAKITSTAVIARLLDTTSVGAKRNPDM